MLAAGNLLEISKSSSEDTERDHLREHPGQPKPVDASAPTLIKVVTELSKRRERIDALDTAIS